MTALMSAFWRCIAWIMICSLKSSTGLLLSLGFSSKRAPKFYNGWQIEMLNNIYSCKEIVTLWRLVDVTYCFDEWSPKWLFLVVYVLNVIRDFKKKYQSFTGWRITNKVVQAADMLMLCSASSCRYFSHPIDSHSFWSELYDTDDCPIIENITWAIVCKEGYPRSPW